MTIDRQRLKTDPTYWDGAGVPEGATHYFHPSGDWYKKTEDMVFAWWPSTEDWSEAGSPERLNSEYIIPRPKTAPEEWVDGLPPVGCECEMQPAAGEPWYVVHVIAHFEGSAVFAAGDDYPNGCYDGCSHPENFRPIRTKQERQRDELAEVIAESTTPKAGVMLEDWQYGEIAKAILSRYNLEPKP